VLLEKERRGATFATTQFFFSISQYKKLQEALKAAGSKLSLIAGILPITNFNQLNRMAQLSGAEVPNFIVEQLKPVSDQPERVRELGIDIAAKLGSELMEIGAPGLHFYTMNSATSTIEIVKKIGLR
jgi:methylenetetrahydrofolate reductase (NADPH)